MDEDRAMSQDIRPLEILILNLMPIKEDTETQLLRVTFEYARCRWTVHSDAGMHISKKATSQTFE